MFDKIDLSANAFARSCNGEISISDSLIGGALIQKRIPFGDN